MFKAMGSIQALKKKIKTNLNYQHAFYCLSLCCAMPVQNTNRSKILDITQLVFCSPYRCKDSFSTKTVQTTQKELTCPFVPLSYNSGDQTQGLDHARHVLYH
jgi:hypothetical protein